MFSQDKIIVIGVNTKVLRAKKLPFMEQAKYFIEDLKEKLNTVKNQSDLTIVVFHEYALQNNGNKIVPYEERAKFEKLINETVNEFDNLVIIAGTILYAKPVGDKLSTVFGRYDESKKYGESTKSYMDEYNKSIEIKDKANKYARNICFVASSNDIVTKNELNEKKHNKNWHRDKVIPYFDSIHDKLSKNEDVIFKPGHLPNIFYINNLPCVVEICMEHSSHFIKDLLKDNKITRPLFHFLVSSPTNVVEENLVGKYNVHVDAASGTTLLVNDTLEGPKIDLTVYSLESCMPAAKLKPIKIKSLASEKNTQVSTAEVKPTPINTTFTYKPLPPNSNVSSTPPPLPPFPGKKKK